MANDLNLILIEGRLGADAEMRFVPSGVAVTTFRMASGRSFKKGDEWQAQTTWVEVECWAKLAEIVNDRGTRGARVQVQGSLEQQEWEDRATGQKRSKHRIRAEKVRFLDKSGGGAAGGAQAADVEDSDDLPF